MGGLIAGLVMIAAAFALMRRQRLRVGVSFVVGVLGSGPMGLLVRLDVSLLWIQHVWHRPRRPKDGCVRMWEDHPMSQRVGFMNFPTLSRDYIRDRGRLARVHHHRPQGEA